jgi:hypothetical protein
VGVRRKRPPTTESFAQARLEERMQMASLGDRLKRRPATSAAARSRLDARAIVSEYERSALHSTAQSAALAASAAWSPSGAEARQGPDAVQYSSDVTDISHGLPAPSASSPAFGQSRHAVDWATLKTATSDATSHQARRLFATVAPARGKPHAQRNLAASFDFSTLEGSHSAAALPALPGTHPTAAAAQADKAAAPLTSLASEGSTSLLAPNTLSSPQRGTREQFGLTRAQVQGGHNNALLQEMGVGTSGNQGATFQSMRKQSRGVEIGWGARKIP